MMVQPAYLWALLTLTIPVAIHLLSRKEGRVIPVGSLRHLQETASQQFRGIKLNELLLLALRLWLLLLFVLLLAGFNWNSGSQPKWIVYDPALNNHPEAMSYADSLQAQGYEWHWLTSGLPRKDQNPEAEQNYWAALHELNTHTLSDAVVVSASLLKNFQGALQPLPTHITWQIFELPEHKFDAFAVKRNTYHITRSGISNSTQTQFVTDTVTTLSDTVFMLTPIQVAVVADKKFESEQKLVEASLKAILKTLPIEVASSEITNADWIIWLSENTLPNTQANLISINAEPGKMLEQIKPHQWLVHDLTIDRIMQENFTVQLASLLTTNSETEQRIASQDRRSIHNQQLTTTTHATMAGSTTAPSWPLLVLFLGSLIAERIVAFIRKQ